MSEKIIMKKQLSLLALLCSISLQSDHLHPVARARVPLPAQQPFGTCVACNKQLTPFIPLPAQQSFGTCVACNKPLTPFAQRNRTSEDFLADIDIATQSIRQTPNRSRVKPKPAAPFKADQAVCTLIQAGQDCVNAILQEETGLTSLMRAAQSLSPAIVQALIDSGADVLANDANGHDAKWHAQQNKRRNIVTLLNKAIRAQNAKKPKTGKRVCPYLPEEAMTGAQAADTAAMTKAIEDVTNSKLVALPAAAATQQTTRTWRHLLQAVCRRCCPRRG